MDFLKRGETANKYNISGTTLDNWIDRAVAGENNLQVQVVDKKVKLLDNLDNHLELQKLANEAKIFKNKIALKKCNVSEEFYKVFNPEEQAEIYSDLINKKEVNLKYYYKNGGAYLWDKFYHTNFAKIKSSTEKLIENSLDTISSNLDEYRKVNVIDIGTGNGYPVKDILELLTKENKLNKYIGIDISPTMLEIATKNISEWFTNLEIKTLVRDVENTKFTNIFLQEKAESNDIVNLALYIGNTLQNQTDRVSVLKNFRAGLMSGDLLMFNISLDNDMTRSDLGYVKHDEDDEKYAWIPKLLRIDVLSCKVILKYEEKNHRKIKALDLDKDYEITFDLFGSKKVVNLSRGEHIIRWQHYLYTIPEVIQDIQEAGLQLIKLECDKTGSNAILICRVS